MEIQRNVSLKEYTTLKVGGVASHFVSIKTEEELVEAFKQILQKNLSVRATEELVRKMKADSSSEKQTWKTKGWIRSEDIDQFEKDLEKAFEKDGISFKAKIWQSRVQAKILLKFDGSMERTTQVLGKIRDFLTST